MLTNYLKVALRYLMRHKEYTAINIFGLAVGITSCVLIMLFVRSEWTYDKFHGKSDRLYRMWQHEKYQGEDWVTQIEKPTKTLESITGKKITYFAYPFGLWNKEAIAKLKDHDFKAVFQLAAARDENDPLYSVRRIIVPGGWSGAGLQKVMQKSFK